MTHKRGTSFKKIVKKLEKDKKYLRATIKSYREDNKAYLQAILVAQRVLGFYETTNPAKIALAEMDKIMYGEEQ